MPKFILVIWEPYRPVYDRHLARLLLGLSITVLICCSGCRPLPLLLESKELQRVTSPDGRVDAVLVVRLEPTVSPNGYEVYIVPHNQKPEQRYLVLGGEKFENARVAWRRARFLEIYYTQGCINVYHNSWQTRDDLSYYVEIRLMPPAEKSEIPPGPFGWGCA
jgi:hypothetical protein